MDQELLDLVSTIPGFMNRIMSSFDLDMFTGRDLKAAVATKVRKIMRQRSDVVKEDYNEDETSEESS
jgi:hypothetical protein